jgi:ABC-2 type transport system permease protein
MPMTPALRVAGAFLKRDFLIAASYKTAFAADLISIALKVVTFYFVGAVFQPGVSGTLAAYKNDYFAFLIIGIALTDFVHTSLDTFSLSVRESQTAGTLEVVLLSPIRLTEMVVYSSLWPYAFTFVRFVAYVMWGWLFFGLDIAPQGIPAALVVLVLTILCFAPLGIISAAIIMVFKKGAWFQMAISASGVLLGGVAYPTDVLPRWASTIGYYLPLTHAVEAMRQSLLNGRSLAGVGPDALFLLAFALVLTPVSLWIFQTAVARTKQLGTLTQY